LEATDFQSFYLAGIAGDMIVTPKADDSSAAGESDLENDARLQDAQRRS
jgi:hypothetical protein